MAEKITITVQNWDKHNPRKDIKHPNWFALSNRILEDPDFFDFTPIEFKACIYIFCQASQKNSATITISTAHAKRVCDIDVSNFLRTLKKLEQIGAVRLEEDPRTPSVRDPYTTLQTEQTRQTEQDTPTAKPPVAAEFDFESLYQAYPRHEGKEAGMKSLRDQIRNAETFNDFSKAVFHYSALMKRRGTELQYVKLWSSFVGTKRSGYPWLNYVQRPQELDQPTASGTTSTETKEERVARIVAEIEANKKSREAMA